MRSLLLVLFSIPIFLGCAHQATRTDASATSASPPTAEQPVDGASPVALGESLDEVRKRLGPGAVEELLSPTERAISVLYGDVSSVDPMEPSARSRAGFQSNTARVLRVTLRNDKVIAVEWLEPARREK